MSTAAMSPAGSKSDASSPALRVAGFLLLGVVAMLAGCGTPGAPSPPSLNLPAPVTDLTAVRTGNQVALAWTMPHKTTDKLAIKGDIAVRVCRAQAAGGCDAAGVVTFAPGAKATFVDALPVTLATGAARPLSYFVELKSPRGRTAGPSNFVHVLAGEAPAAVTGLAAQLRKDGVVLRWAAEDSAGASTAVRLHRTLLTATKPVEPGGRSDKGLLGPEKELVEQTLLVDAGKQAGIAIDKTIRFGETYEYRAQRVERVMVDGQTVELAGPISAPIRVEAVDTFAPDAPAGLAAVATAANPDAGGTAAGPAIDLSWLPDTEADLAGYAVYRREDEGAWVRVSAAEPVVGPGFHDPHVEAGHVYHYAVAAIDKMGHKSARSIEAEETVPAQ